MIFQVIVFTVMTLFCAHALLLKYTSMWLCSPTFPNVPTWGNMWKVTMLPYALFIVAVPFFLLPPNQYHPGWYLLMMAVYIAGRFTDLTVGYLTGVNGPRQRQSRVW